MNMNRIAKLSAAVALGLSLMGASLGADAASARSSAARFQTGGSDYSSSDQVVHLGTIVVTRADEEGVAKPKAPAADGRTVYLGRIEVTAKDSEQARYAAAQTAAQPGTAFLGTVEVTAKDTKPAFVGKTVVALRRIGRNAMVSMISALAFVRVGG